MTAKDYLKKGYLLDIKIKNRESDIANLEATAADLKATDYSKDVVKTSGKPDAQFTVTIERIRDIEERVKKDRDRLVILQEEIRNKINEIPNDAEKEILYSRYILFNDWESIANDFRVTVRYIHVLHGRALDRFSKIHEIFLNSVH